LLALVPTAPHHVGARPGAQPSAPTPSADASAARGNCAER